MYRGLWTGVHVAIKFLKSSSPDQLNLSAREAILSRFVSHPNVVQVLFCLSLNDVNNGHLSSICVIAMASQANVLPLFSSDVHV